MKLSPYREVAKRALMSRNELSEEEATKIVGSQKFKKIESKCYVTSSMMHAINSIADMLNLTDEERQSFSNAVFAKDHSYVNMQDELVFQNIQEKWNAFIVNDKHKSIQILKILSAVHDGWVVDNASEFNKEGRENERYQHLPIELIGWEEAQLDMLFIEPILNAIGIEVDEEAQRATYEKASMLYISRRELLSKQNIVDYILNIDKEYQPITNQNKAQTEAVAIEMTNQIITRLPILADLNEEVAGRVKNNRLSNSLINAGVTNESTIDNVTKQFDYYKSLMNEKEQLEREILTRSLKQNNVSYEQAQDMLELYSRIKNGEYAKVGFKEINEGNLKDIFTYVGLTNEQMTNVLYGFQSSMQSFEQFKNNPEFLEGLFLYWACEDNNIPIPLARDISDNYRKNSETEHQEGIQPAQKEQAEVQDNQSKDELEFNRIVTACKNTGLTREQTLKLLSELGFENTEERNSFKQKSDDEIH